VQEEVRGRENAGMIKPVDVSIRSSNHDLVVSVAIHVTDGWLAHWSPEPHSPFQAHRAGFDNVKISVRRSDDHGGTLVSKARHRARVPQPPRARTRFGGRITAVKQGAPGEHDVR